MIRTTRPWPLSPEDRWAELKDWVKREQQNLGDNLLVQAIGKDVLINVLSAMEELEKK